MKNQNSISKPTVITKPSPSVSTASSLKKEKVSLSKKMEFDNHQQQTYDFSHPNKDLALNITDTPPTTETPSTPLTDKVSKNKLKTITQLIEDSIQSLYID